MAKNTNSNVGNESGISGEYGENFIAYLLSKKGVNVVRAKTVGFDLFAIDKVGYTLPKDKLIGISVKMRASRSHKKYVPTIPMGSPNIIKASITWNAIPYIGIVIGHKDGSISAYVFPFDEMHNLKGRAKRKDVVAVSTINKLSSRYLSTFTLKADNIDNKSI
jgi:Holliday junction resolvase